MPRSSIHVVACAMAVLTGAVLGVLGDSLPASWDRGTVFFAFGRGDLTADATLASLRNLSSDLPGTTNVAVQWMWRQSNASSSDVDKSSATPTMDEIVGFTSAAQALGFRVLYKPIVVGHGEVQMPDIDPSDPVTWFHNYKRLLLETANTAQFLNVSALSIGLELQHISTNHSLLPLWQDLIAAVRSVYSGKLTYCSMPLLGEAAGTPFWPLLDFIGLDLYLPLMFNQSKDAPLNTTTRAQMLMTYKYIYQLRLQQWVASYVAAHPDAIFVVTESGYPSCNAGIQTPWIVASECTGPRNAPNFTLQYAAIDVQFEALLSLPIAPYLRGFYYFMDGNVVGTHEEYSQRKAARTEWACGWTPLGKPAQGLLTQWFSVA